ncbi:hypothetical protein [Phenylobacterium montanum]|uniref:Uncharacterized protein n=1 Tax=Phenylobacterium montanum TaxID=2823693 RepID=A0A975G2F4_9CAUL|nr:hypothetical protein [Caulobacter sp. S6]QUD89318.1 hypothetical protein KCG34_05410 [Caulobacter sp. S6]
MQPIAGLAGRLFQEIGVFETAQLPLLVAAVLLAIAFPRLGGRAFARFEAAIEAIALRPWASGLLLGALLLAGHVVIALTVGAPRPIIPDEASLLLQSDTLAHGRLANPGPLPDDFSAIYVLIRPAYASIYPVLRSFPLTVGQLIGGGPWIGVWLSMLALCLAVYGMLRQVVRPGYALVGALLVAGRWGLFSYWANSYWGGAFTALGGVLLVTGYLKLDRRSSFGAACLLGAGVFILMTTRPYEGLAFAAAFAAGLGVRALKAERGERSGYLAAGIVALAWVFAGFALTAAHDWAVTGDWKLAPYSLYRRTVADVPAFWMQSAAIRPPSAYFGVAHFIDYEREAFARFATLKGGLNAEKERLIGLWNFYVGWAMLAPFAIGCWRLRRWPVLAAAGALLGAALVIETWDWTHYAAPGFALVVIAITLGLERLRAIEFAGRPIGVALSRLLPLCLGVGLLLPAEATVSGVPDFSPGLYDPFSEACCWLRTHSARAEVQDYLAARPGRHLVIVDSGPRWPSHQLVVFNQADPGAAKIVWVNKDARLNPATIAAFPARAVWRLDWRDNGSPCLTRAGSGDVVSPPAPDQACLSLSSHGG